MRGLQLLNSDESLQEGEVRNDELQGVSITHLRRVNNISLHNFCNCLQTQKERAGNLQAVRGKENVEMGIDQVADRPWILAIMPALC